MPSDRDGRALPACEFVVGDILRGPRGGEVVVMHLIDGRPFVYRRHGWNTMSHELKHPEKYVKIGHKDSEGARP